MPAEAHDSLRRLSIFDGIDTGALDDLEQKGRWIRFKSGEMIYGAGELTRDVFFLTEGEVSLSVFSSSGKIVHLQTSPDAYIYGNITCDDSASPFALEAETPCLLLAVRVPQILAFLSKNNSAYLYLVREVAAQLRAMIDQVVEFGTFSVRRRVHAELLRRAQRLGRSGPAILPETLTHSDIALHVGTNRETVTRELRRLQSLGILVKEGSVLVLPDIDRLDLPAP